ncbi:33a4818d-b3e2-4512-8bc9-debe2970f3b5 [Thermothielavioides terrestris]|uniref:BZIP domain-containing protein n=2 Tax=Thermothielavioides terrestris TaxID=2587410 RepID=G2RH17_THETT|nr:uncharacterized protein THITE_2109330 [Thermothielavioides terrestris NRRL 8126]XP_003657482.1 uncharacterized protein THITE_2123248 [Thermothielavioides terrestris NRRL 8126]AEO63738.1 hypothetical protein THITE_2109330 [Thermothielavioides terrestris NRRL 8126]AEO71146.1 hypothetical protein THITE_2123248 [Thermothielavioides terrestris NRRL 8126]SPQ20505.1 33a4818d-b3e2-4512-8bc9-debe2970f3b5 [Thermothielavioides terrestris]
MEAESYRSRVHKFSSKPPGHKAARQRANQRRHRARVKGRIAELESALSNAEARLADALRRIGSLTAEVRRLQHALDSRASQRPVVESTTDTTRGIATNIEIKRITPPEPSGPAESSAVVPNPCITPREAFEPPEQAFLSPASPLAQDKPSTDEPTPVETHGDAVQVSDFEDPNNDYPLLPPPRAGESTMPCRDAYEIITERSAPGFDLAAATEWLKPGFRRAVVPGAGCRVQTHLLFALVDRITSNWGCI